MKQNAVIPEVYLESDDQGVLAGEEYVHVGDQLVVGYQHQPEHKERSVLKNGVISRIILLLL